MEPRNGAGQLMLPQPQFSLTNDSQLLQQRLGSCNGLGGGVEPSMVKSNMYGAYPGLQGGQFPPVMPYMPPVVMPYNTNMAHMSPGMGYPGMPYAYPHMEAQQRNMMGLKQQCLSCGAWKPQGRSKNAECVF